MLNKPADDLEFETLIVRYQHDLVVFVSSICPNQALVEDIVQDTNRIMWEKRGQFDPGTNFLAWARTIAKFQMFGHTKRSKKKWLRFNSELVAVIADEIENQGASEKVGLDFCIARLSKNDQSLLKMRYNQGLSLARISRKVGRSEGALKQVFLRVRRQLKECVDRRLLRE